MPPLDAPDDALDLNAAGVAALADPTRRSLYRFVAAEQGPVSREQAAEGVDVPAHTAKFHLDRLVEEGLLEVEFRRLTGRTGPGAGRPAKLYRRSGREFAVSLPQRNYDLLSEILARAVEEAVAADAPMAEIASRVARREGESLGAEAAERAGARLGGTSGHDCLQRLAGTLRPHGYEPRVEDQRMLLENCPFDKVAREHTDLVCGLNVDFVDGMASGLGCADLRVSLEPSPGRCCVSARPGGA